MSVTRFSATAAPTPEPVAPAVVGELEALPGVRQVGRDEATLTLQAADDDALSSAVALLVGRGAKIREVKSREPGLEQLYLSIVREAEEGDDA